MDPAQPPDPTPTPARPPARPERGGASDPVIDTLKGVSLFDGLDDEDLARIRRISEALTLLEGETLFEEGEKGDTFFVIVRGAIELSKDSPKGRQKLAVLRKGQAFGEMALLNRTPRSATATAVEPATLLTISHDAFADFLGGDSISLRIMKALSKALWATSVRLTAKQTMGNEARAAVGELNRVVRGQLTAKHPPSVPGFDVAVKASFHPKSRGAASWDAFRLQDGRDVLVLMKAEGAGMLHAQNLAITRALMRETATRPHEHLGAYMDALNAALRRVAVPGLSHPVTATLIAASGGEIEWATAGPALALWAGGGSPAAPVASEAPALGAGEAPGYRSERRRLAPGEAFLALAEGGADVLDRAGSLLEAQGGRGAADLLAAVVEDVVRADAGIGGTFDVIGALIVGRAQGGSAVEDAEEHAAPPLPADAGEAPLRATEADEPAPSAALGQEVEVERLATTDAEEPGPFAAAAGASEPEPLPALDGEASTASPVTLDAEAEPEPSSAVDDAEVVTSLPTFDHEDEGEAEPLPGFDEDADARPLPGLDGGPAAEPLPALDAEAAAQPLPAPDEREAPRPVIEEGFVLEVEDPEERGS